MGMYVIKLVETTILIVKVSERPCSGKGKDHDNRAFYVTILCRFS